MTGTGVRKRLAALESPQHNATPVLVEHKADQTREEALAAAQARYPGRDVRLTLPPPCEVDMDDLV